jgi:hypothetical protein
MAVLSLLSQLSEITGEGTVTDIPIQIVLKKLIDIFGYQEVARVLREMNPKKRH